MKLWLIILSILICGCSSIDVSNIYTAIDGRSNGYKDQFKSQDEEFEIYSQSEISNENAVAVALLRANKLCNGQFLINEIESGVIVSVHCSNCGMNYYYKTLVKCQP